MAVFFAEVSTPKLKALIPESIPETPLNVEGKLVFNLLPKRLEGHILKNNDLIDLSMQRG